MRSECEFSDYFSIDGYLSRCLSIEFRGYGCELQTFSLADDHDVVELVAATVAEFYLRCISVSQELSDFLVGEGVTLELARHGEAADVAFQDMGIADYGVAAAYRAEILLGADREEAAVGDELLGLVVDELVVLLH